MSVSELIYELTGVPERKQKRKFKRCRRQFLAVKLENGAVRFYGSYNVRCSLPIEECVRCRHYINVNVLVPAVDVQRKGLKRAVEEMVENTWGNTRKLIERYVLGKVDEIVKMLEEEEEVRLV